MLLSKYERQQIGIQAQQACDAIIMSLLRQNDIATSFWHNNDVIAPYVQWEEKADAMWT